MLLQKIARDILKSKHFEFLSSHVNSMSYANGNIFISISILSILTPYNIFFYLTIFTSSFTKMKKRNM